MQSFFFWKNWNFEYKTWWYALLILLFAAIVFLWAGYFRVPEGLTEWNIYQSQKTIDRVAHTFEVGNFEFAVPIESYVTLEYFNAGPLQLSTLGSYMLLGVLIGISILLLTIITTLPRFWYYIGTGLFVLFLVSLRLDVLELFGYRNFIPTLIAVIIYVSVSFYFNAFHTVATFTFRMVTFLLITIGAGVFIALFSDVEYPFLYLSISSFVPCLIITVLFIFMIAHEILAGFVYLTSQSSTSSKSLQHFIIISLIYIVNLVLTYMNEVGLIEWDFIFINLYLLFTVSAILAIWGYKRRESLYSNIISYYPLGAYFIIGLAIIAFTTTGAFLLNYNDAALKIIRDIIIFSHIGFGVIFLLYFTSNFLGMMLASKNVYKVLYNPTSMPYATYRIAGLIVTFAFIFYSQWHTYVYYGTAGIFNSMGDVQQVVNDGSIAESYYRQARLYAGNNFHSNYILAGLEVEKSNFEKAHLLYNTINWTKPTEASLINNANLYLLEDNPYEMASALEDGLQAYPTSGLIKNNLGYTLLKLNKPDSAFILFDQARASSHSRELAEINITGLMAQNEVAMDADSLIESYTKSDAILSNAILMADLQNKPLKTTIDPLKKRELTIHAATLLNNYIVAQLGEIDTAFIDKALTLANDSLNSDYSEALKATLSHAYYYQNNVARAMALMGENAYVTESLQGKFNYTMGLWALEQGNAPLAVRCFSYSVEQNYKEAKIYYAIALAEARMMEEANAAAHALLESKIASDREIGTQLKKVFATTTADVLKQSDLEKYQYCRYRLALTDSTLFNRIINTLDNPNYKALIILEMAQRQFTAGSTRSAIQYFNKLEGIRFTDKNLNDKINHFELEILASRKEIRLLGEKINQGVTFPQEKQLQKLLYTALIQQASGDTLGAKRNYEILAVYNPFFEEGVIGAANFFKDHSTDRLRAYTILAEAKQINPGSIRLLMAYITEATRVGFDDFAADAYQELEAIRKKN